MDQMPIDCRKLPWCILYSNVAEAFKFPLFISIDGAFGIDGHGSAQSFADEYWLLGGSELTVVTDI